MLLLCAHGCNQDSTAFASYMKNLLRILKPLGLEVQFLSARYQHSLGGMTWYHTDLMVEDIPKGIPYSKDLVGDTLEDINKAVSAAISGGQDVVLLGFSQGGNLMDTYLRYEYPKHPELHGHVRGVILMSAYSFVDPMEFKCEVPCLNIYSPADMVVPMECRPKLYSSLTEISHPDGHIIPKSAGCRQIKSWLETLPQS